MQTELHPNLMFTELEPNTNLFLKYSEPGQNQTLIIKEPELNLNPEFGVFSSLISIQFTHTHTLRLNGHFSR